MSLTLEKINEQNLGIQYLQGDLSEEQQTEFEIFLMENPEYLDELELLKVFNENLEDAEVPSLESTRTKKLSFLQIFGGMAFGALATILVLTGSNDSSSVYPVSEVFYLESMRSSSNLTPVISIPVKSKFILLSIPLKPSQSGEVDLEIINASSKQVVLRSRGLSANAMGEIAVTVSSKLLSEGSYELSAIDANGNKLLMSFQVIK